MRNYFKLLLLFLVFLTFGCAPFISTDFDDKYSLSQEYKIQNQTYERLQEMPRIDSAFYLEKNDFSLLLGKTYKDFLDTFTKLDAPSFSKASFGNIKISLSKGQVRSKISFSFVVDSLGKEVFGHLMANHTLKAGKNKFIINTKFDEIVLEGIDKTEALEDKNENKDLIEASIKSFLHTINIEVINMPLKIDVDMNILSGINGKDIFVSNDYKLHSAAPVNMQTKMQIYVPYISEKGVVLLGSCELKEGTPYHYDKDLKQLKEEIRRYIDSALNENMGIDLDILQKYSSYYVSKRYLSAQMNRSLSKMDLRVINKFFLKIPEEKKSIEKNINFFDKSRLPSCEGVKVDCNQGLSSCNRQCDEKYGIQTCAPCNDLNNPFSQVRCMSKYEACKSKEELNLYECNKRENRCELENFKRIESCETQNLERVSICKEDKEKLSFINDEITLAGLKIDFDILNSYAVQRINKISFDKDFLKLRVNKAVHISVDSKLRTHLLDNTIDDINCSLKMDGALLTHSQLDYVEQNTEVSLSTQRQSEGKMLIKAISKPTFIGVVLKNSPYEALMKTDAFKLQCYYKNMPMQEVPSAELFRVKDIPPSWNIMTGQLELGFEEEILSFVIRPVQINKSIYFYPTMENRAISFSRQTPFF